MTSISKKKIALIEKYNQEKLRNKAMKMGVTLKSPETVFLSNDKCSCLFVQTAMEMELFLHQLKNSKTPVINLLSLFIFLL